MTPRLLPLYAVRRRNACNRAASDTSLRSSTSAVPVHSLMPEARPSGAAENTPKRGMVAARVLEELRAGGTVHAIAVKVGVSEVFVRTMLDHYDRIGILDDAQSFCSSGLGACHTTELSDEARVHCAGCPLTI